ncbi:MAG: ABC-2 family transporter protein, partial [Treponema sp.]|nr:ABC-2 family transporter protein [Treponema sp.]MBQ5400378.1 ABC-2 family transporter protein [Treponema sp.]
MLTFVLPFGLISSLPVETLFFNNHGALFLSLKIFLMSAAQLTFALIVWRINISKYESTGS